MNRFFSKLDLRDIKIDPRTSRFLPDAEDEVSEDADVAAENVATENATVESEVAGDAPEASPETNGAVPSAHVDPEPLAPPAAPHAGERPRYVPSWAASPADAPAMSSPVQEASAPENGFVAPADAADVAVQRSATGQVEVLKVSARSRPSAVAGAIAGVVRESGRAEVQAIGAGATNQAVKAVAIASDYLRETGIEAICLPAFIDVTIENEDRTAIRLVVEPR